MNLARLLPIALVLTSSFAAAQGTAPTFRFTAGTSTVTLPGHDPAQSVTTNIPTILVPLRLEFEAAPAGISKLPLDATHDVPQILRSPIFTAADFAAQGHTQYVDAMLRATVGETFNWHTLLAPPEVHPLTIKIPAGYGYLLASKTTGTTMAMADAEFIQQAIFKQIPNQPGKLIIVVTHNVGYYTYGDATVCCSWGTHGVDNATGNSFVLASYLSSAPSLVEEHDIQPLTGQLAEWVNDPLHDPLFHLSHLHPLPAGENLVPSWKYPSIPGGTHSGCGGASPANRYTLQTPIDTHQRSDLPVGSATITQSNGTTWHLANIPLMTWYLGGSGTFSFPDTHLLTAAAATCPTTPPPSPNARPSNTPAPPLSIAAVPSNGATNGHQLIGYWTGSGPHGTYLRLRDISPQWDTIIVAFANVDHKAPEGTMQMHVRVTRSGEQTIDPVQLKEDIAWLKARGKRVLISLGGGGETFTLDHTESIPTFVNSVSQIVTQYGFDGIDLDFESPSLVLDAGDTDFRHPTTPSIVNLITSLRQLHDHFGPNFVYSLVPEGTQIPGGYSGYGGQFGSYVPILWATRDILTFIDIQDYNTPPFEGLDGEIYQLGSANYDAAMTELLLQGFPLSTRPGDVLPPTPANKVAVGFLTGTASPSLVRDAMQYIITGHAPAGVTYKLRNPAGYPAMLGAMFWTIDSDRMGDYNFSNTIGPQLHGYK